jgi:hypothetical protein
LRVQLAAEKNTEIHSLLADFAFRSHFDQVDAGGKGIATALRSLDQVPSPKFDAARAMTLL